MEILRQFQLCRTKMSIIPMRNICQISLYHTDNKKEKNQFPQNGKGRQKMLARWALMA